MRSRQLALASTLLVLGCGGEAHDTDVVEQAALSAVPELAPCKIGEPCPTIRGDGVVSKVFSIDEPPEQCDGKNLAGQTCASLGFVGGMLRCNPDCTFDTSGCTNCGDGVKDPDEECDGADLGGLTCGAFGDLGGTLGCNTDCTADTSGCSTPMTQVSAGRFHTCGIKMDGTAVCWGFNGYGQSSPPPGGTFKQVSAGGAHTCGIRTDDSLVCWGSDYHGQASPPAGTFKQVSAGYLHTCAVKTDGNVACWGDDAHGQSSPPAGTFTQVSAGKVYTGGKVHTCGLTTDGLAKCWGVEPLPYSQQHYDSWGLLKQVSAGWGFTCGLDSSGLLHVYGDTFMGFYGGPYKSVAAGVHHLCVVRADNTLFCWGKWHYYGWGFAPPGAFLQVTAGVDYTCGLRLDHTVQCWGENSYGQASPP